jgi:hypothetical protein
MVQHNQERFKNTQKNLSDIQQKRNEVKEQNEIFNLRVPGNERGFLWLMEKLLPPSDQIKGCELLFPETVFFEQGKPKSLIKSDKD